MSSQLPASGGPGEAMRKATSGRKAPAVKRGKGSGSRISRELRMVCDSFPARLYFAFWHRSESYGRVAREL